MTNIQFDVPDHLSKAAMDHGLLLGQPEFRVIEVSTPTGVYFVRAFQKEDTVYILPDLNGEMIETCKPGGIMLDIGACVGRYTIPMALKASHVYAFEPDPTNFKLLQDATKNFKNITYIQKALSNKKGTASLHLISDRRLEHTMSSKMVEYLHKVRDKLDIGLHTDTIEVETTTLDDFCQEYGVSGITGIKIDVEGAEQEVLEGAAHTLAKERAIISLELHEGVDLSALQYLITTPGYKIINQIHIENQYLLKKPA